MVKSVAIFGHFIIIYLMKNNKALIIGSGPIRIGQACEFDYSGTQACKALKELGYNIILINSNPATIMTDPSTADKTYICPLTYENAVKIIKKERPNYILTSFGGQTALNLATQLYNNGVLQKYKVQVAGTSIESISESEDRIKFKNKMSQIQIKTPYAYICNSVSDIKNTEFPVLVRSSFALGGNNSKMFQNLKDLKNFIQHNTGEHLVEESILGWQELEVEVVRDYAGNKIVVCYIENIDPVGIHTEIQYVYHRSILSLKIFKIRSRNKHLE
jgi:carbamoyl-phosphate synthase large subunit